LSLGQISRGFDSEGDRVTLRGAGDLAGEAG
jgi:hypothetical protein